MLAKTLDYFYCHQTNNLQIQMHLRMTKKQLVLISTIFLCNYSFISILQLLILNELESLCLLYKLTSILNFEHLSFFSNS